MVVRAGVTPQPRRRARARRVRPREAAGPRPERASTGRRKLSTRYAERVRSEPRTGLSDPMRVFNRYLSPRQVTVFSVEMLVIFGSMTVVARASELRRSLRRRFWKVGAGHRALPAVPVLQRLLRPDGRAVEPRADDPAAAGGRRRVDSARAALPVSRPSLVVGGRRVPRRGGPAPLRHPGSGDCSSTGWPRSRPLEERVLMVGTGRAIAAGGASRSSRSATSRTTSWDSSTRTRRGSASRSSTRASSERPPTSSARGARTA